MKIITANQIENAVYSAAKQMCFCIDKGVYSALKSAYQIETGLAKDALSDILENADVAQKSHVPVCQDTGIVVAFCTVGTAVKIDGDFNNAINEGVRRAYQDEYLRKSVVDCPLNRQNTNTNTPCVIYTTLDTSNKISITLCPKGAGSENMGRVAMLTPADGVSGIADFVVETVKLSGGKACPPLIVGVGIGGDMTKCAMLSKQALLCGVDKKTKNSAIIDLERDILQKINSLGMGAMGLKGKVLALKVNVLTYPCHIASLPVAVSLMCHACRHETVEL